MSGASVEILGLRKNFGSVVAVESVTMSVQPGEVIALVGPSGCGKSTLLRIIAGLETPTAGTVRVRGRDVTALAPGRRNVGMVFQQAATLPYLTVAENLAFGMKVRHVPAAQRRARVAEIAELLGIGTLLARRPAQLSGGERQRVELGRALLREPDVLLLDEPLTSLDAHLRVELRAEIARIQREVGTTTLVVTHDQTEAMVLGMRVGVMSAGSLAQLATPTDLYDAPADTFVARFVGSPQMNLLPARVVGGRAAIGGANLEVVARDGEVVLGIRPSDLAISRDGGMRVHVESLEDQGADIVVRCTLQDGGTLHARVARDERPVVGTHVMLAPRRLHVFDPVTTRRLEASVLEPIRDV
jgi:ABC-type sugar transport system ATPase subunit